MQGAGAMFDILSFSLMKMNTRSLKLFSLNIAVIHKCVEEYMYIYTSMCYFCIVVMQCDCLKQDINKQVKQFCSVVFYFSLPFFPSFVA